MSKFFMGVDEAYNVDYSGYCIVRLPYWWEKLLRKWGLSKATWQHKVIYSWVTKPKSAPEGRE